MAQSPKLLVFSVRRRQPELITPAKPTPHVVKLLSDIDDQDGLRFQIPFIFFYPYDPSVPMAGKDPARVLRGALAEALVFYHPLAGRLREGPGRKLMVDCNGEGVLFIEADADVRLDQFGDALKPPFPCFSEILYDVPGSGGILNCPLLLIQVTRLKCGGFIFALRLNHTMCDGVGIVQFMSAIAEMAQGAKEPFIAPLWRRELLGARDPPRITCTHREYEYSPQVKDSTVTPPNLVQRSFFFGPREIAAIRRRIDPQHLSKYKPFHFITACLWRCRTIGMQMDPNEEIRLMVLVDGSARFNPPLPLGYYGNRFVYPAAVTTAGKLSGNPLEYALEIVKKGRVPVTEEYIHSVADSMVIKGRRWFNRNGAFFVGDLTQAGFKEVNFGWGNPVYGGLAQGGAGKNFYGISFFIPYKNTKGEEGIIVPVWLPAEAMDRFANELDQMVSEKSIRAGQGSSFEMKSSL